MRNVFSQSISQNISQYLFLFLILFGFASSANAKLMNIVIDGGQIAGLPIAILPFHEQGNEINANSGSSGGTSFEDVAAVIRADLQSSGQFKSIAANTFKQFPKEEAEVQYPYWKGIGAEDLVVGSIQRTNDSYTIQFKLLDVVSQKPDAQKAALLSMRFDNIHPKDFRALAHHISDLIFEKLIGIKGIFSTRIAYVSVYRDGSKTNYTLEVADSDGHNPQSLLRSKFPIMSPAWSPDAKKIAFVSFQNDRSSVNIVNIQTGEVERISQFPGINGAPAWSPDGQSLALVLSKDGSPKIYTVNLATKHMTRVTEGSGIDTEPRFAPDGRSIVFTSNRGGKPQIYRVSLASGQIERLTFSGEYNARPSITPDGKRLVMMHQDGDFFGVAVQNLHSGEMRVLTHAGQDDSPCLAPNGMMVIYGSQEGRRGILGAVTLDGRVKIRLPLAGDAHHQEPAWAPFAS